MNDNITPATGDMSRRIHGAVHVLRARAASARTAAARLDKDSPEAVSLRGKATAYNEAAGLLLALDRGHKMPSKSHRWERVEVGP